MANRTFQQKSLSLVKREVRIYCVVSVGSAGAVTLKRRNFVQGVGNSLTSSSSLGTAPTTGIGYVYGGDGVRSVARTGTGAWTVTLSDSYQYLLGAEICQTSNTGGLVTSYLVGVDAAGTNVNTNTANGNGGVIALVIQNASGSSSVGAAVDPASGDTLTLRFTLGDATEP